MQPKYTYEILETVIDRKQVMELQRFQEGELLATKGSSREGRSEREIAEEKSIQPTKGMFL